MLLEGEKATIRLTQRQTLFWIPELVTYKALFARSFTSSANKRSILLRTIEILFGIEIEKVIIYCLAN